jgi:hypothetical protein
VKNSEREQAHHKKSKQDKKKELVIFFGQGLCVPAPSQKETPIDIVVNKRKDGRTKQEEGNGELPSKDMAPLKGLEKVKAKKKLWAEEDGQKIGQGDEQKRPKKIKKKPSRKGSDVKTTRRSKRTKSNNEGLALKGKGPNGAKVNLKAMKGSLRKKGAGATKSKGFGMNDKKR